MNRVPSRRSWLAKGSIGIGWLALSRFVPLRPAFAMSGTPTAQGMIRVEGAVRINGAPAAIGDRIEPGDSIATGVDGSAVAVVAADAFLIRANSVVRLQETSDSPAIRVLRLTTGKLLSVFAATRWRRVETPHAIIGIRGTGLYVEAETTRTYACTCYGETTLAIRGYPAVREFLNTVYHDHPRYLYAGDGPLIEAAPVKNHTDAELIMLERLVGRVPAFQRVPRAGQTY